MRVFVTGATGFIGTALTKELIGAGHQVLGLCRSEEKAPALAALGGEVFMGTLDDLDRLKQGAASADGVVHLAFIHDFSKFAENAEIDRRAIEAMGSAIAGSDRLMLVTSGVGMVAPGRVATEADKPSPDFPRATERAAAAAAANGAKVSVVRLPQVHDTMRQGLVSYAIQIFREKGACAYVGDGGNRWSAAHVGDVARLYRLALEKAAANATYHAVAEEGVAMRDVVETIARRLKLPVRPLGADEVQGFFGWFAMFAGLEMSASSDETRRILGWQPEGPGLIADLERLPVS